MAETNAVSLESPHFWAGEAKIWFAQAESTYKYKNLNTCKGFMKISFKWR